MFFRGSLANKGQDAVAGAEMALLSRYAGVGLWDALLHDGDPMHAKSRWRWSDEFRLLVGFDHGDTTGFPDVVGSWSDRLHPEDAPPTFQAFGACLADRTGRTGYDVTYRLKMKDGNYRWFRAIGGVARDAGGRAERACGALIDVHAERDQAERAALLDRNAGVGLWDALFHDGDPMHAKSRWRWSDEFRRLIGFGQGDTTGFPDVVGSWSDRLHPEDAPPTFQAFGACLNDRTGRTGYDVTYRLEDEGRQLSLVPRHRWRGPRRLRPWRCAPAARSIDVHAEKAAQSFGRPVPRSSARRLLPTWRTRSD